ncbi:MAG: phosphoribosylformylglycinamidine synthase I [candidate division Zixibacteria bacterium 4484_93]|nr:MAG: phosphoribosylformylglycinamidine synthase I [candidate division Zixibacteria bacterium 4484_93]
MKAAVVVFPGSNCDRDCYWASHNIAGIDTVFLWHKERYIPPVDLVILPGGFSYGDYLRAGAIARVSPIMGAIRDFAASGGLVLGICNGFQILTESGLLPGVLVRNKSLSFLCQYVYIRVERNDTPFTRGYNVGDVLRLPIAHNEGNFFAPPDMLDEIERKKLVLFRYCDSNGNITEESNPNGSLNSIAGITNENGNILGMMPHPERASELILGSRDGLGIFESLKEGYA